MRWAYSTKLPSPHGARTTISMSPKVTASCMNVCVYVKTNIDQCQMSNVKRQLGDIQSYRPDAVMVSSTDADMTEVTVS